MEKATAYLATHHILPYDEPEKIPVSMHWIQDPAGTVFILGPQKD
ncbi:hypothetical protein [Flavobacterium sp.]